jgi:hypothetical protein
MRLELEPDMSVTREVAAVAELAGPEPPPGDVVVADLPREDAHDERLLHALASDTGVRVVALTLTDQRTRAGPAVRWVSRYRPDSELVSAVRGDDGDSVPELLGER